MRLFEKKREIRSLTTEEEIKIKKEILRQILIKTQLSKTEGNIRMITEKDIRVVKKIKELTNMSTGQAKALFIKFRNELAEEVMNNDEW